MVGMGLGGNPALAGSVAPGLSRTPRCPPELWHKCPCHLRKQAGLPGKSLRTLPGGRAMSQQIPEASLSPEDGLSQAPPRSPDVGR